MDMRGCALGCSSGATGTLLPLETELATNSTARQEDFALTRRHDTAERAHHASQRGDDQRLSARLARRRGTCDLTSCRLLLVHQIGWGHRSVKRAQPTLRPKPMYAQDL